MNIKLKGKSLSTFVNDKVGKDNPIKKPKTTPINVVTISLMLSFGFLLTVLQSPRWNKSLFFLMKRPS